jgi:hypothetical protein
MRLVRPSRQYLASYVAALEQGWLPDNVRGAEAAREELQLIAADADAFLASMDDREAKRSPIALPDGTKLPQDGSDPGLRYRIALTRTPPTEASRPPGRG